MVCKVAPQFIPVRDLHAAPGDVHGRLGRGKWKTPCGKPDVSVHLGLGADAFVLSAFVLL